MPMRALFALHLWVRVCVVLLLVLAYLGTAPRHHAYSQGILSLTRAATSAGEVAAAARGARSAEEVAAAARGARSAEELAEAARAAKAAEGLPHPRRGNGGALKADAPKAPHEVAAAAGADARAAIDPILKISYYFNYFNDPDVFLMGILEDLGYSPIALSAEAWRAFPTVRKLETAYRAAEAEKANPGGGNDLLVHVVHKLAERYESITYDRELQGFLALPPTPSITFAAIDVSSSPAGRLPRGIQEVVNAIVRFCDPCDVLGGMHGILEKHLEVKDAIDILRSSPSNTEALARAFNRLSLPEANARLKAIVGILQGYYESARDVNIFNELMGVPSPRSYEASRQTGSLIVVPRQQASVQE